MNTFLKTYNLLRQNHEEIEDLNRPLTRKEIESIKKKSKKEKNKDRDVLLMNSTKYLKNQYQSFSSFPKTEEITLPNSFYKNSITLIPKTDKYTKKKITFHQYP